MFQLSPAGGGEKYSPAFRVAAESGAHPMVIERGA